MKSRIFAALLVAVVGSCTPETVSAQQTPPAGGPSIQADASPARRQDAEHTRDELRRLLDTYPRAVGEVLRRDPTLLGRPDYMASYPPLAQFIAQHPDIARNVEFYFEGYGSWGRQLDPEYEAMSVLLAGMAAFLVMSAAIGLLTWLVRAAIQHRRWMKASQMQADVHSKLMDRMTTNEELLAYIQSPAGRRFLEAAPIRPEPDSPAMSAPVGPIIWAMMAGIVLTTVGIGFRFAGGTIGDDVQRAFTVVGVIVLALGIGFILSSIMAYVVSARLGLFPARSTPASESGNA